MKFSGRLLLTAMACATGWSEDTVQPSVHAEMNSAIKQAFPYLARADDAAAPVAGTPETQAPALMMNPFKVIDRRADMNRALEERRRKEAKGRFNLHDGGTLLKLKNVEVKWKYDPEHDGYDPYNRGWDFLSIRF